MDVVLISKKQFKLLDARLKELNNHLKNITAPAERFIDNKAFVKLMNISYGTAQAWRDEGKIGFTKEENTEESFKISAGPTSSISTLILKLKKGLFPGFRFPAISGYKTMN